MVAQARSARSLVADLQKTGERYSKLRSLFSDFCKMSAFLVSKDSPLQEMRHSINAAQNLLELEFCGVTYKFRFSMDYKSGKGIVTCSVPDQNEQSGIKDVGSFTFVGTGDSDVKDEQGDPLRVNTPGDSSHLILHIIHGAMEN